MFEIKVQIKVLAIEHMPTVEHAMAFLTLNYSNLYNYYA